MLHLIHQKRQIVTWRGCTIQLFPHQVQYFVYLVCYATTPYHHAKHYLGSTCSLDARLHQHEQGRGARLLEVIHDAGISWHLVRLWECSSYEEMRALERKLKKQHSPILCPECNPRRAKDVLVGLRQGHYPFGLFSKVGKRRPMPR
jgi:predicted GIY-YIG superfamily endonuclease